MCSRTTQYKKENTASVKSSLPPKKNSQPSCRETNNRVIPQSNDVMAPDAGIRIGYGVQITTAFSDYFTFCVRAKTLTQLWPSS